MPIPDRGFIFWFQRRDAGAAAVGGAGRRWCRRRSSIAAELRGGCRRPPAPPRRRRGAPACSRSRFSGWISGWRGGALYPLAVAADRRGRFSNNSKTRRLLLPAAAAQLCLDESNSKERLRVSIGSAKTLYAVQHIMGPTRVRTVADRNSAVTPVDLRSSRISFQGQRRRSAGGQLNRTMNLPRSRERIARARTSPFSSTGNTRRRCRSDERQLHNC